MYEIWIICNNVPCGGISSSCVSNWIFVGYLATYWIFRVSKYIHFWHNFSKYIFPQISMSHERSLRSRRLKISMESSWKVLQRKYEDTKNIFSSSVHFLNFLMLFLKIQCKLQKIDICGSNYILKDTRENIKQVFF